MLVLKCLLKVLEEKQGMAKHRYTNTHMKVLRFHPLDPKLTSFLFPQQMEKRREREGWFALSAHVR